MNPSSLAVCYRISLCDHLTKCYFTAWLSFVCVREEAFGKLFFRNRMCVWEEHKEFRSYNAIFLGVIAYCFLGFTILSHVHHDTFRSRVDTCPSLLETVLKIIRGNEINYTD
jgi:hypothetical protein